MATYDTIDNAKIARETLRRQRDQALESNTANLLTAIEQRINDLRIQYLNEYPDNMQKAIIESSSGMTQIELKYLEQKFTDRTKEETGYLDKKIEVERMAKSFLEKLFGSTADGQSLTEIEHDIDKSVADDLFEQVKSQFAESVKNANRVLNENSKICWQNNAADMREKITSLIMGTTDIVDEKKSEISEIIASYQDIPMEESAEGLTVRSAISFL